MQWTIDPVHSQIQFAVRHLGISSVRGTFGQFSGSLSDENGVVTGAEIDIEVASINTNMSGRDDHLRSADFFDVATHPVAHFSLTGFEQKGDQVSATGTLSLHGVTKPLTLRGEVAGPIKDPWGNTKVSATLEGKISRKEWGLTWNQALETGGLVVSDEVKLTIDVQAAPAVVAAAA